MANKKQKTTLKDLQEVILSKKRPPSYSFLSPLIQLEKYLVEFGPKREQKHKELFSFAKLHMDVMTSVSIAAQIAKVCIVERGIFQMESRAEAFVRDFLWLEKYNKRVDLAFEEILWDKIPDGWQVSRNAGIKFGRITGYSAFGVASKFARGVGRRCEMYQKEAGIDPQKYNSVVIIPKPDPCIIKWMSLTGGLMRAYIPHVSRWGAWLIDLDCKSIIYKIYWEFTETERAYWDKAGSKGKSEKLQSKLSAVMRAFESSLEDPELTDTESFILEALGSDTLKGPELLKKAGYDNSSHYRSILSNLVKRKILDRNSKGYYAL
jgi:hypothetical protein